MKYLKHLDATGKSGNTQRFIKKSNGTPVPTCSTIGPDN
ncbi:hypothetical protein BACCIP111899_00834 [Bacillus rhizoplanae]|uniref:Uncharacterized protein n=1 Tax=Bacillus rhizoplanae TaxID=2880966 RepID=A0ABM8Y7F4_9BACI|nr:hypothetical protein BACCIP111899_00834 [Bacillus rhizoplanae]